jgi:hypothetical protein
MNSLQKGDAFQVTAPQKHLHEVPHAELKSIGTGLLCGETGTVLDIIPGWYKIRADLDGYEGFVLPQGLTKRKGFPTHRVAKLSAKIFYGWSGDSESVGRLSLNSLINASITRDGRVKDHGSQVWIAESDLVPIDHVACDPVATCELCLGLPYYWGGRDAIHGYDCSGLIQAGLISAGISSTRNTPEMEIFLGTEVYLGPGELPGLYRGDLVFWSGHVGVMLDNKYLLHATSDHGAVIQELLQTTQHRRRENGKGEITSIRRLA